MRIALFFVTLLLFSSYFLIAQVKEDIIKKHLTAIGGEKNWQNIKTISSVGVRISAGVEVEETRQIVMNKALRIDYKFKTRDAALAQKNYFLIINENQGWRYLPDNLKDSVEALTAEEIKYYKTVHFTTDPFVKTGHADHKIEYLNKENILNKECYKFSITGADGQTGYVYLDAVNYLICKRVQISSESESESDFEDYRKVGETFTVPFTTDLGYEKFVLKEMQINKPVNEQIFKLSYRK